MKKLMRQGRAGMDTRLLAQSIDKAVAILQATAALSKAQSTLIAAGIRDYDGGFLALRAAMDEEYQHHEATIEKCTFQLREGAG